MKIEFEWEIISECLDGNGDISYTKRAKVFGGWILQHYSTSANEINTELNISESMLFINDPFHQWEIDEG